MKQPSKILIGATTVAALVAPYAPKNVTINVSTPASVVAETKMCSLVYFIIDDKGRRFCEYRCGNQLKIVPEGAGCEKEIREALIK